LLERDRSRHREVLAARAGTATLAGTAAAGEAAEDLADDVVGVERISAARPAAPA
jgi:hypothetical protein